MFCYCKNKGKLCHSEHFHFVCTYLLLIYFLCFTFLVVLCLTGLFHSPSTLTHKSSLMFYTQLHTMNHRQSVAQNNSQNADKLRITHNRSFFFIIYIFIHIHIFIKMLYTPNISLLELFRPFDSLFIKMLYTPNISLLELFRPFDLLLNPVK